MIGSRIGGRGSVIDAPAFQLATTKPANNGTLRQGDY
jgi:hypothetical protein